MDMQQTFADRIGGEAFGTDTTEYKFAKIKRAKGEAQAANPGIELIDMGVGEPDNMAASVVVEALGEQARRWENRTYTDNGLMSFRESVQTYMRDLYGVDLDPETQICHCIGAKSALSLLPACFIDPGDVTLRTVPGYPVLGTWTKYLGGFSVELPIGPDNDFFPELEGIPALTVEHAKLLYLNYPNNPTGAMPPVEKFQQAIEFALANGIVIVHDAAYAPLRFDGEPFSILSLPGAMDCCLELHSMSKGFNMTGWRLGWVCGNAKAVKAFAHVKDNADSGQFAAIQEASRVALANHRTITESICAKYERRLKALCRILCDHGFDAKVPGGSFYLYVKAPRAAGDVEFEDAEAFSQWLIRTHLISTVPWDDAGHYVRFGATFVASTREREEQILTEIDRRLSTTKLLF
jgi:LL-diaminopimelate aminotransferase